MDDANANANAYEEARKLRVEGNLKLFQGLGITVLSKSLLDVAKCETKKYTASSKSVKLIDLSEPRRSKRARKVVPSYQDEIFDVDLRPLRRSSKRGGYTGFRIASYEEKNRAIKRAERLQSGLQSGCPSFIKSMVRSHVYSCFWLGLPNRFCRDHLPTKEVKMVLQDENNEEYETIYIASRTGLSGGWRGFALDHKLDDGDALLFVLIQPRIFKVYIIKAAETNNQVEKQDNSASDTTKSSCMTTQTDGATETPELPPKSGSRRRSKKTPKRSAWA